MRNIEFTTRHTAVRCDRCGVRTQAGINYIEKGSIVMFDCLPCAILTAGEAPVLAAVEVHKEQSFRQMEATLASYSAPV